MKSKLATLFTFLFFATTLQAQVRYLKGMLQPGQETSSVTSGAGGTVIVKYNTATNFLQLFGNYRNLTAAVTMSHIHGFAAPGVNAGILFDLTNSGGITGTLTGSATLTEVQEAQLLAGNMYANVHTGTYPGGEIRAQLTAIADGQAGYVVSRLQGAQEVPPTHSAATGRAYALIDKDSHTLYLTGSYSGLTAAASNAHIHQGEPRISGGVIVPLIFTPGTSGTVDTAIVISTVNETNILNGNTYVNVHTPTYGLGEVRGQLLQLDQTWFFANVLSGSQEFPPTATTARGTVIVKYNSENKMLELTGDYQNLSATISGSHIHGPAGPGENANVIFNLTNSGGTTGTLTGSFTLDETQEAALLAGNMYVNVHSTGTFAGGEIRGQLNPAAMGASHYFTGLLQASQSVSDPAVSSPGTGNVTALLDRVALNVWVTGDFTELTSNINNTHIHGGAAGSNGPVVVPLLFAGTTSGTITGAGTVRSTLADSMINGLTYVNIHTANYTAGEIRAQLGNLVLPLKLNFFNAYRERNTVAVVWEAADEGNLSYYEIQQLDAATSKWITKRSVAALHAGFTNKYKYDDLPLSGAGTHLFYRLKMVDKEGRYSYSQIIRINNLQGKAELMLLSNPVQNGQVQFIITGLPANKKATAVIIDYNGRVLAKASASTLTNNFIPVTNLSSGRYRLQVKVDDIILQQSFIK